MINQILCAVEFSHFPSKVVEYAAERARALQVPLTVIYSYRLRDNGRSDNVVTLRSGIEAHAREQFAQLEEHVLRGKNVPYQFLMEVGFLTDRIESHIRKNNNLMLVISVELAKELQEQERQAAGRFFDELAIPVEYVKEVGSAA